MSEAGWASAVIDGRKIEWRTGVVDFRDIERKDVVCWYPEDTGKCVFCGRQVEPPCGRRSA